eukprot:TRINITY_DN75013_c0_g1_i1.p1 TRINITY_DN75013_c0_g1~~TRINITY_DN75013_c0_g1_i1.p1  ORF type:complete len:696 (+),score=104.93 TRINITY_DN75013_c0_g1_i1:48-2135(+)
MVAMSSASVAGVGRRCRPFFAAVSSGKSASSTSTSAACEGASSAVFPCAGSSPAVVIAPPPIRIFRSSQSASRGGAPAGSQCLAPMSGVTSPLVVHFRCQWCPGNKRLSSSWRPPTFDCYGFLALPRSATSAQIREAYLARAKTLHPDLSSSASGDGGGGGKEQSSGDAMAKLNICYETLTRHRAEYDASLGEGRSGGSTTKGSARANAYASGREAWWTQHSRAANTGDDFGDEFTASWEEVFSRHRQRKGKRGQQAYSSSWHDDESVGRRSRPDKQHARRSSERWKSQFCLTDSDSSSSSEWDSDGEDDFRDRRSSRSRRKSRRKRFDSTESREEVPSCLWVSVRQPARKNHPRRETKDTREAIVGAYRKVQSDFNGRPAFAFKDGTKNLHIFWSREFGDWKVAERLEDDGACLAFCEDAQGNRPPWASEFAPKWRLWDPVSRRFVPRRLRVQTLDSSEEEEGEEDQSEAQSSSSTRASRSSGGTSGDDRANKTRHSEEDGHVPWSRPEFSEWTTADLVRWCETRDVDLSGCFDRESVLERVSEHAAEKTRSGGDARGGRGRQNRREDDGPKTCSSDGEGRPRRRRRNAESGGDTRQGFDGLVVRVASRVKTDGSYTKPPSLDRQMSLYGNRREDFVGDETDVLPWLYDSGDKSRLYGVFFDGHFGYSLVWKQRKYWGRPNYSAGREASRRNWE